MIKTTRILLFITLCVLSSTQTSAWQSNIAFKRIVAPYGLTYSTANPTYTKWTTITNNTATVRGNTPITFSISPALPAGLSFNTSTGTISGTPTSSTYSGSHTVTAANGGGSTTANLNITVNLPTYTWIGAAAPDTSWSTGANWSSGSAPPSTSAGIAYFDDECGANCNATISSSINIYGIRMKSTYTGTITQASGAGNTITMFTDTFPTLAIWIIEGGTFTGGNADIRVDSIEFLGGTFTSTSANLKFGVFTNASTSASSGFRVASGATFNHNNGTVYLESSVASSGGRKCNTFNLDQATSFYNLTIDCEDTTNTAGDGYNGGYLEMQGTTPTLNVYGTFNFKDGYTWKGDIYFYGSNADFECDSLATRRYCVRVPYEQSVYGYVSYLTQFHFVGGAAQTYTYDDGAGVPFNFVINNAAGVSTPTASGRLGLMRLHVTDGTFQAPPGELSLSDDYPYGSLQSSAGITVDSPGVFDANGGTVTIEGTTHLADARTFVGIQPSTGSITFNNLTLDIACDNDANEAGRDLCSAGIAAGASVYINGDLRVKNGRFRESPVGGGAHSFYISGNYYRECANYSTHDCADTDLKANKRLTGATSQVYIDNAAESDCDTCTITIDPGAGNTVTVNNKWNLRGSTSNFTVTSGTVNIVNGAGILIGNNLTNNSAVTCTGTGLAQYYGSLSGTPGGGNNAACYSANPSDATASAVNWVDFTDTSASQTISGIYVGITLQISRVNVTGTPTCQYRQNGGSNGAWTTVATGTPATLQLMDGDGLEFKTSGTSGHSCTFTITNVSDSSTTLDTVTGTAP